MENAERSNRSAREELAGSTPVRSTVHFLGVVRYKKKGHIWDRRRNIRDFTFKEAAYWVAHRYIKAWRALAKS